MTSRKELMAAIGALGKRVVDLGARVDAVAAKADAGSDEIGLWSYNKATGYWKLERMCEKETAQKWLGIFKSDEPQKAFKLSKHKPSGNP